MILYNYSSLRQRDKKIYSIAGTQVSATGISLTFLKVVAPCAVFTTLIGVLICIIAGKNYFNPLSPHGDIKFLVAFPAVGICIGLALWYIRVESYRLYEYLLAYFKPKKTYHNLNDRNNIFKLYKLKTSAIIKSDF